MQRFLKINCKIVTRTKGVFDGVLIITPSALMFDPLEPPPPPPPTPTPSSLQQPTAAVVAEEEATTTEAEATTTTKASISKVESSTTRNTLLSRENSSIYDEASALIPIEIISNVIMYEDLALKDVQEYFEYQNNLEYIFKIYLSFYSTAVVVFCFTDRGRKIEYLSF